MPLLFHSCKFQVDYFPQCIEGHVVLVIVCQMQNHNTYMRMNIFYVLTQKEDIFIFLIVHGNCACRVLSVQRLFVLNQPGNSFILR